MPWYTSLELALLTLRLTQAALDSVVTCTGNQCPVQPSIDMKVYQKENCHAINEPRNHLALMQKKKTVKQSLNHVNCDENETIVEDIPAWRMIHDVAVLMKLRAYAAVESWRKQIGVGVGLLILLMVLLTFVKTPKSTSFAWQLGLTIAIATSWVGIAQLARVTLTGNKQSLVHLIVWANSTMWLVLGVPHVVQRLRAGVSSSSVCDLWTSEVFSFRHTIQFFFIAFATNSAYISALNFLSASLNTAIFSTSAIFTFGLTLVFLKEDSVSRGLSMRSIILRSFCIGLSVLGVLLISEAWNVSTSTHIQHMHPHSSVSTDAQKMTSLANRLAGVGFSIAAAFGTAVYQVTFKATFGNHMTPETVGLFLAHLGLITFVCYGTIISGGIAAGLVDIDLTTAPWGLIALTAVSSAIFNFLIKFGIVYSSPVTVSLATQLGIPLNLGLDLLLVGARIDATQTVGVLIMLVSLSTNAYIEQQKDVNPPRASQST